MTRLLRPLLLIILSALLVACATGTGSTPTSAPASDGAAVTAQAASGPPIVIGSKDFTEAILVAEMYAILLEDAGLPVERKLNLGGTPIAHTALINNEISLYPEYTSTGLLEVLKLSPISDPAEIVATLRREYESQFQITWLEPAPFNNTNAFATTPEVAAEFGLSTYTDLAAAAPQLILGGPAEFPEREDTRGLQEAYGGFDFQEFVQLGTGSLRYQALQDGQVQVIVAFGTDGQINGLGLVLLEDDKNYYPIYQIAPVVRQDILQQHPQIADTLNRLAPLLTNDVMSGLNWQVDGPEGREIADVAREFIESNGLLTR